MCKSRYTTGINYTGVVDTSDNNTGSKFAASVNDPGGKQWEQYQTADTLKWIWRKKIISMLTVLPKDARKMKKKQSDWRFFWFTTSVNDTGGASQAANISENFMKKFEMALLVYSGACLKLIHEKTWSQKSRGTVPFSFK